MRNSLIILFLFSFFLFSCKPSYPVNTLEKTVERKILKEIGYKSIVFLKEKTFYIFVDLKGMIDSSLNISSNVFQSIQNIVLIATNASLSTDAKIKFFSVVLVDSRNGVKIVFKQYIYDVELWFNGFISRDDFFSRSLSDVSVIQKGYVFNKNDFRDIKIEDFILEQTIYRMKNKIKNDLDSLEKEILKLKSLKINNKNELLEKYNNILNVNQKVKKLKFINLFLSNAISNAVYVKSKVKNYFFYTFKDIDTNNFFNINYYDFAKNLALINKEICKIYKFNQNFCIVIKKDNLVLYSNFK